MRSPDKTVTINDSDLNPVITLRNVSNKISSKYIKRMEIDHIKEAIEGTQVIPDFGFDPIIDRGRNQFLGWNLLYDLTMSNMGKYERVSNYIDAKK